MKHNLTWLTFYFCSGITFAYFFRLPFWLVYFFAAIFFIAAVFCTRKDFSVKILFPLLTFTLGCLLLRNAYILPRYHVSKFIFYKNATVYTIKGFINSPPVHEAGRLKFIFSVRELGFNNANYQSSGDIVVYLKGGENLSYADALLLRGSIHKPFKLYSDNIAAVMHVGTPGSVVRLPKNHIRPVHKFSFYLKEKIEKIIYRNLSALSASILDAMVLGEKANIPSVIYDAMIKSGSVHILVVSGFNVGVVAFIIMLLLKILRLPRRGRYLLAIPCLIIYCFATGSSSPVVRATVMAIFFLLGFLAEREPDIYNSLSLAALFILLINPKALLSISFQLSFMSVLAIVYLYPKLKSFLRLGHIKSKIMRFIAEGFLVSFSAWLGTFGLILCYFKVFSPVTVLANIFIVPIATLITLCGFSLVAISLVLPALAMPFAWACELLVVLLLGVNNLLIQLPFAYLYL